MDISRVIRITTSRRNVFMTLHRAKATDLRGFRWLIQYGSTEFWYEKPTRALLKHFHSLEASGCETQDLLPLFNARPIGLETPRVWASAALTTPTDDDVETCTAGHAADARISESCQQCVNDRAEALDNTSLVYCLVLSTCQASDPYVHGAHFNGRQIYKLVKCGSREAAVAEAFYAAGVNGWSVVFSCVMRFGEDVFSTTGTTEKVDELWTLTKDNEIGVADGSVRIFY
ncbi:hypothetical protein P153DRAFT_120294 [Dothidotthia symphoricarpi CBS 119687]|uniref:Uncharacterized protein n=1 Tax=Dothidotthia symphoricarpi CBS 119687 TaxID=1392245 RepID=A0A6A6A1L5_9PLEO|nr:uncharacterized protein P153DRAFT_120294 [Dothidotthia symphoricarpi CBS 119687]KAF2125085.1 hypothetical protein P153DRAFT_120294 [Dothidotthia symphoricarpi CBS 119687]